MSNHCRNLVYHLMYKKSTISRDLNYISYYLLRNHLASYLCTSTTGLILPVGHLQFQFFHYLVSVEFVSSCPLFFCPLRFALSLYRPSFVFVALVPFSARFLLIQISLKKYHNFDPDLGQRVFVLSSLCLSYQQIAFIFALYRLECGQVATLFSLFKNFLTHF